MSQENTLADPFGSQTQSDNYYAELLEMQKNDPEKFAKISPAVRLGLGFYVERKQREEKTTSEQK